MILRSGFAEAICAALGLYIVITSALRLYRASGVIPSRRNKSWLADVILSVLLIIFGLWLMIYPLWPGVMVGTTLTVFGIELIGQASTSNTKRKEETDDGIYYVDDFKDKSDES